MASTLDYTNFTFTAEQTRDINSLIYDDLLQAPEITLLTTVYPGIVFDKEIGFIGEGGLVGKARQGCNPTPQNWTIGARKVTWTPKSWEILLDECFADLESTAAVYSLKTGVDIADFTSTDYMTIVVNVLSIAIKKFIFRLVWFNDVNAENVADGGIITDGVDVSYFNILDGLWKQLLAQTTVNAAQRVTITENAAATYALQALDPDAAVSYLESLKFKANVILRAKSGIFIACTQSVHDAYEKYLQGKGIESTYSNLVNGLPVLKYNGIPLIPVPMWDEMIAAYQNTGTKLINPHRALLVHKDYLAVGVDGNDSFDKMNIWYEKKERKVYTELMGKADAKLLNPAMFMLAI